MSDGWIAMHSAQRSKRKVGLFRHLPLKNENHENPPILHLSEAGGIGQLGGQNQLPAAALGFHRGAKKGALHPDNLRQPQIFLNLWQLNGCIAAPQQIQGTQALHVTFQRADADGAGGTQHEHTPLSVQLVQLIAGSVILLCLGVQPLHQGGVAAVQPLGKLREPLALRGT